MYWDGAFSGTWLCVCACVNETELSATRCVKTGRIAERVKLKCGAEDGGSNGFGSQGMAAASGVAGAL